MKSRSLRNILAAPVAISILALAACSDKSSVEDSNAMATDTATASSTEWVAEPAGPKADVTLPTTPMTTAPEEGVKGPVNSEPADAKSN